MGLFSLVEVQIEPMNIFHISHHLFVMIHSTNTDRQWFHTIKNLKVYTDIGSYRKRTNWDILTYKTTTHFSVNVSWLLCCGYDKIQNNITTVAVNMYFSTDFKIHNSEKLVDGLGI